MAMTEFQLNRGKVYKGFSTSYLFSGRRTLSFRCYIRRIKFPLDEAHYHENSNIKILNSLFGKPDIINIRARCIM